MIPSGISTFSTAKQREARTECDGRHWRSRKEELGVSEGRNSNNSRKEVGFDLYSEEEEAEEVSRHKSGGLRFLFSIFNFLVLFKNGFQTADFVLTWRECVSLIGS